MAGNILQRPAAPVSDPRIPKGWSRNAWIERLKKMAELSKDINPGNSAFLLQLAREIEEKP